MFSPLYLSVSRLRFRDVSRISEKVNKTFFKIVREIVKWTIFNVKKSCDYVDCLKIVINFLCIVYNLPH